MLIETDCTLENQIPLPIIWNSEYSPYFSWGSWKLHS